MKKEKGTAMSLQVHERLFGMAECLELGGGAPI